jgi:pyruvate,water dikinase
MLLPIGDVVDAGAFGEKAASLGAAIRAGLAVPPGIALASNLVDRIASGDPDAVKSVLRSADLPRARLAVRSSAIGEDPAMAAISGRHASCLNVLPAGLPAAVYVVWEAARLDATHAQRMGRGTAGEPAIGVVIQQLVDPIASGVLFTRNPITGADERVIEAAWGLGEIVISGQLIPDRYRLDAGGRVIERAIAEKDVQIQFDDDEGTSEQPVAHDLWNAACLDDLHLDQLHAIGERCREIWKMDLDVEWTLAVDGAIYLLQTRPLTLSR